MLYNVEKRGNKVFVNVNTVVTSEKEPNEIMIMQGKMLFDVVFVGPKDAAKQFSPSFPSLMLSKADALALGRLLIAEAKD